ncbi:hypothetical protein KQI42_11750 [Tissierella sp. MSJ-40]|uniref:Gram-positive cocci surface proteins LPxTG domain-containing protein n=1 Tax=Tissierella simiarum TaxID=2841534 RepID=A0ABS6E6Z8_9FIRM|nr:hypothetical protein [Tissierella simiarum]MBU5438690.1 hypothetical protein [Tissierella simiarum]
MQNKFKQDDPKKPRTPVVTVTESEPEEEVINEEIPEAIIETPVEDMSIEDSEDETIEEELPKDVPKMPKTGELSPVIYYGTGLLFLLMGIELGFKRKE